MIEIFTINTISCIKVARYFSSRNNFFEGRETPVCSALYNKDTLSSSKKEIMFHKFQIIVIMDELFRNLREKKETKK